MARREPVRSSAEEHRLPIGIWWKAGVFPRPRRRASQACAGDFNGSSRLGPRHSKRFDWCCTRRTSCCRRPATGRATSNSRLCTWNCAALRKFPAALFSQPGRSTRGRSRIGAGRGRGCPVSGHAAAGGHRPCGSVRNRSRGRQCGGDGHAAAPLVRNAHGTPANEVPR